ncbi:aldehyde dehydrogenase (NADP(+)) [Dactylosporangium sp. NPDC050588]|uniref:aldehyde dehydrogenase (NADP(+)) n=1 Tax=Dactylosporangium sp. NPDC050588 TaxID=3157211 RepID=UPI0033D8F069
MSIDVRTGKLLSSPLSDTGPAEIDHVCAAAAAAAPELEALGRDGRARLLDALGDALEANRARIVGLADAETGLGTDRLNTELTRTSLQLSLFADVLTDGAYLEATIDHAADTPIGPRPDLRRMLVPIGPVAVFGASNFPLAFSVPGGDTASALAAGCPVVVKAHPAHPATSAACHQVFRAVLADHGLPPGTVGLVSGHDAGAALVRHPAIAAVGFTGSTAGGRALFDIANSRPAPIPFYGELGSTNPLIVTSAAAVERATAIAAGFAASMTLGTGQFCTKPGLLFVPATADGDRLVLDLSHRIAAMDPGVMLSAGIRDAYQDGLAAWRRSPGVTRIAEVTTDGKAGGFYGGPALFSVDVTDLSAEAAEERFGPAALVVRYRDTAELAAALSRLGGQLTVTVHAAESDEPLVSSLLTTMRAKAGRIIFNGFPTGVAVAWAQHHGGPQPASTAPSHTSVGATSIRRWLRPIVYQDAPAAVLPAELTETEGGAAAIPRRIDGSLVLPNGRRAGFPDNTPEAQ